MEWSGEVEMKVKMGRKLSKQLFLSDSGKIALKNCLKDYFHILKSRNFMLQALKGQLQRFDKLVSYERVAKILKNDICITEISQAVLEKFEFKVDFSRKIPKIRNFADVSIIRVEQ